MRRVLLLQLPEQSGEEGVYLRREPPDEAGGAGEAEGVH